MLISFLFFKCATKQVHTRLFSTSSSQWKAMRRFNALDIERRCMCDWKVVVTDQNTIDLAFRCASEMNLNMFWLLLLFNNIRLKWREFI